MAKTKEASAKSRELFLTTILPKTKRGFDVLKEYQATTKKLKEINGRISYEISEDNFAEVVRLKNEMRQLEDEIVQLDNELNSDDNSVSQKEIEAFNDEYIKEQKLLTDNHKKLLEDFGKQAQVLADAYGELVENRNRYGHNYERSRFITNNITNSNKYFVSPDDELCKPGYYIAGGTSTVKDLALNVVEPKMRKAQHDDYLRYFNGEKKW